jgi:putative redox protein
MANIINVQVNQVSASTSEGSVRHHKVLIDRPMEKGGEDKGTMGGELMLLALGGCFMSTLLAAIKAREANVTNVNVNVAGTLDGNPVRFTAAEMTVQADFDDQELMEKLVTIAERSCIVSNTLKDALQLTVRVDRAVVS